MAESQFLSVIRVWAALAWADGVIADAEAAAMKRLIKSAELTDDERKIALGWLEQKVDLETANITDLAAEARRGIYRAAARLAAVDLDIADTERAFLDRLRDGLDIGSEAAAEIEASIPGMSRKK
jgi:uncharacterized membrane protein YebE (DUF533 family)